MKDHIFKLMFVVIIVFQSEFSFAEDTLRDLFPQDKSQWEECLRIARKDFDPENLKEYHLMLQPDLDFPEFGIHVDHGFFSWYSEKDQEYNYMVEYYMYWGDEPFKDRTHRYVCWAKYSKDYFKSDTDHKIPPLDSNRDAMACGSEIDFQNKTMAESVPVTGVDFGLVYSTQYNLNADRNNSVKLSFKMNDVFAASTTKVYINPNDGAPVVLPLNLLKPEFQNLTFVNSLKLGASYSDAFVTNYDFTITMYNSIFGVSDCSMSSSGHIDCSAPTAGIGSLVGQEQQSYSQYKTDVFGINHWLPSNMAYYSQIANTVFLANGQSYQPTAVKNMTDPVYGSIRVILNKLNTDQIYIFDSQGRHRETRQAYSNLLLNKFNYLPNNKIDSIENQFGQKAQFTYDSSGNILKISSYYGLETNLQVDGGLLIQVTDPTGVSYKMGYDSLGLLTRFEKPNLEVTEFSYAANGDFIAENKNTGQKQNFDSAQYNGFSYFAHYLNYGQSEYVSTTNGKNNNINTLTTSKINDQNKLVYQRVSYENTNKEDILSPVSKSTQSVIDDLVWMKDLFRYRSQATEINEGLAKVNFNVNSSELREYKNTSDVFSLTAVTTNYQSSDGYTQTSTTRKDSDAVRSYSTNVFGENSLVEYNNQGLPKHVEPYASYPIDYEYDVFGRLTKMTKGKMSQTMTYDSYGYLKTVTNQRGHTTTYNRDIKGQVLEAILPNGDKIGYTYTDGGEIKSMTTPNNQVHRFQYEVGDYLSALISPKSQSTIYNYDSDKRITRITKPTGQYQNYIYKSGLNQIDRIQTSEGDVVYNMTDSMNRLRSITSVDQIRLEIDWVMNQIQQQKWYDDDGSLIATLSYDFHDDRFLVRNFYLNGEKFNSNQYSGSRLAIMNDSVKFIYGRSGYTKTLKTQIENLNVNQYEEDSTEGDGHSTTLQATITSPKGEQLYLSLARSFDSFGQASEFTTTTINNTTGVYNSYSSLAPVYDENNRLIKITRNRESYFNGTKIKSVDFYNQYSYPPQSNNNVKEYTQKLNIDHAAIKRTVASHNEEDQLIDLKGSINRKYTYTSNGELKTMTNCYGTTTYTYDAFSNLKKIIFPDGKIIEYKVDGYNRRIKKLINGITKEYYLWYDNQKIAAILDEHKQAKVIYVYGPESSHAPSFVIKDKKMYKIILDPGTSSVRYVVDPTTTQIMQELEYDEYGNMLRNTNPGFQQILFTGGMYDEDTKLIRLGARDYDPTIGRWTTKDPIGFAGGDTNLYNYVGGDPMSRIDPTGLWGITIGIGIGGYLGGGADVAGGIYFGSQDGHVFGGVYGSGSTGFGGGAGVGVQGTYYPDANSISGSSVNYNANWGILSGTRVNDPNTGQATGYGIGLGVGSPRGGSVTFGNTGTLGILGKGDGSQVSVTTNICH